MYTNKQKSELKIGIKILIALFVPLFVGLLSGAIFGVFNGNDQTDKLFTILVTAGTFMLAVLTLYPQFLNHTWKVFRIPLRYSLVFIVPFLIYLFYWAFIPNHVIKIGVSVPLSGPNKQDGIAILNAVKLAVSKHENKLGTYTLEVVPFDDTIFNNDSVKKPEEFTQFISDFQIAGIIGPFNSGVAIKEIPEAQKKFLALISPANTADCLIVNLYSNNCGTYTSDTNTYFRTVALDSFRANELVKYLVKTIQPHGNIVIYQGTDPFSASFAQRLSDAVRENANLTVTPILLSDKPQEDIAKINTPPDIILYAGTGANAIAFHSALQDDPRFAKTIFAAAATIMNQGFTTHLHNTASSSAYAIAPMAYDGRSDERWTFEGDYITNNGMIPTPYSASAYDATNILLKAIERAITEDPLPPVTHVENPTAFRKNVIDNITQLNKDGIRYTGVTGTIRFAKGKGDVTDQRVSIYTFDNVNKYWRLVSTTQ